MRRTDDVAPWAAGSAAVVLALFGLLAASRAVDLPFQLFGLTLFLFGVACVFGLIVSHTGNRAAAPVAPGSPEAAAAPHGAPLVLVGGEGRGDAEASAPQPAAIASSA